MMPMINLKCPSGHEAERYIHSWERRYSEVSRTCGDCGHPMFEEASFGTPLLYFSEKRARYIDNLDATIRSHGEHVRVMKERGVEPATDWHVSRKISDGIVPRAKPQHPKEKIL